MLSPDVDQRAGENDGCDDGSPEYLALLSCLIFYRCQHQRFWAIAVYRATSVEPVTANRSLDFRNGVI
ncbi:hypothetical protein Plhal304r1_c051g0134641 [Plasmopara halstedii]